MVRSMRRLTHVTQDVVNLLAWQHVNSCATNEPLRLQVGV